MPTTPTPPIRAARVTVATLLLWFLLASAASAGAPPAPLMEVAYPEPTGPHPVGVHDFVVTDTAYPAARSQDAQGRRLMVRVWYPAASAGARRRYFEAGELAAIGEPAMAAISAFVPEAAPLGALGTTLTHGSVDAPVAAVARLPVVIYSHGGLGYVSANTALMEELASHGYLAFSVTHPGGSAGILYPGGEVVGFDADYHAAVMATLMPDEGLRSPDVGERFAARSGRWIDDRGLGPWLGRWRDDMIAVADFVERCPGDGVLAEIVARADPARIAYFGMSYGGSAAASAAHADPRALGAVDLDGTHNASDLLGIDLRVPLLLFTSESADAPAFTNEFFFEALDTMGERTDIVRVRLPEITHLELTDAMFLPRRSREVFPGGGRADGRRTHAIIAGFLLGFLDRHLRGADNGFPAEQYGRFPEAGTVDLSPIRAWARAGGAPPLPHRPAPPPNTESACPAP